MITSGVTVFSVILGYISDSLADDALNPIDYIVLERLKSCWRLFRQSLGLAPLRIGTKQARIRAIQRFILTLRDQQLVTGIAILSTQYLKRCTMSGWHQQLVICLAWFSSLTHMTTLTLLRDHLSKNKRLRLWRAIAMFCVMVMLFISMIMAWLSSNWEPAMPFQCLMTVKAEDQITSAADVLGLVAVLLFLIFYYGDNFLGIFSNRRVTIIAWLRIIYWKRRKILPRDKALLLLQRLENYSVQYKSQPSFTIKLKWIIIYFGFIRSEFARSFLWEIIWMLSLFTYSVAQVSLWRWNPSFVLGDNITFDGNEDEMGFGQIIALFLIALPFLGIFEAFGGQCLSCTSEIVNRTHTKIFNWQKAKMSSCK